MTKHLKEIIFDDKTLGKIVLADYFDSDLFEPQKNALIYSQKRIYDDGSPAVRHS